MHHCFTDYILAHLERSLYMVDLEDELAALSAEEREQTWKQENPHPCRTTCPGSATQPDCDLDMSHEDRQSDDDWDDHNIMHGAVLGTQTRRTTHSSALTPLLTDLDVGHQAPLWLWDSPTTFTPTTTTPLTLPEFPIDTEETPGDHPQFVNFQIFETTINQTRVAAILARANDGSFGLSAGSVPAAARGLVNAVKGVKQNQHVRLAPYQAAIQATNNVEPDFYLIEPAEVTLSTMFSWGDWMFRA
jgi:hypothetical protein